MKLIKTSYSRQVLIILVDRFAANIKTPPN